MWTHLRTRSARLVAALYAERQEVTVLVGLASLGAGLWIVSHAAALIVIGAILLWVALPTRKPFVARPEAPVRRAPRGEH